MCGIAGFLDWQSHEEAELRRVATQMADCLDHRGPDDAGVWVAPEVGLALAHRRLSILDLSPGGHQPMVSSCGRFCITYNGEVYNHAEIRADLETEGRSFRSTCDTEVLLEAISQWGLERALSRLVGMFAFALWDTSQQTLTLVRDALGIKPLYYGRMQNCWLFASELKAIRAHPVFCGSVDRHALAEFLRHGYVPAPLSIYEGLSKLPPGCLVTIPKVNGKPAVSPSVQRWWSLKDVSLRAQTQRFCGTEQQAAEAFEHRFREAVSLRMRADVPLGAFLSGGIDSSLVVAMMQDQSERRVSTFSIGFEESGFDEAPHARAVAGHLGTEHTEYYVTPDEAREVIPRLPELYDEPFADPSQIPTFLVSQLARRDVKVCLSGDGGDELFYGYERYRFMTRLWQRIGWCPRLFRRFASECAAAVGHGLGRRTLGRKLRTFSELAGLADGADLYHRFHSHWRRPEMVVADMPADPPAADLAWPYRLFFADLRERMMFIDAVTYLPDDILVKVDRASMAVGLEVRVPLLDHRLVAFVLGLPFSLKSRGGESKWLLRQVLDKYVPRRLIDRPKMGFGVPIGAWLRGPLRGWAAALLDPCRLQAEGYLMPAPITEKWHQHLAGEQDWQYLLWNVLMFQAWLEYQRD